MTTIPQVVESRRPRLNWQALWRNVYQAVISLVVAFLVGGLLLLVSGRDPLLAYSSLLYGAFGTVDRFAETLVKATPLLLIALAVSFSFRCQVWNIGAEGQFIMGAIASTWIALTFSNLPVAILLPLTLLGGALAGGLWSMLAGLLKSYANANEVITTTMLNYIAVYFLAYLLHGPLIDPAGFNFPQSALIADALNLPRLIPGTRLNVAFIVAVVMVALALVFWRSIWGMRVEIVGASQRVAKAIGLGVSGTIVGVTFLSGAMAGVAGWGDIFGIHFRLIEEIARGMGSLGMVIALLGELHPVGMVGSSLLFAALVTGGNAMERNAGVPFALVDVIQGCIILLVLARTYFFRKDSK